MFRDGTGEFLLKKQIQAVNSESQKSSSAHKVINYCTFDMSKRYDALRQ